MSAATAGKVAGSRRRGAATAGLIELRSLVATGLKVAWASRSRSACPLRTASPNLLASCRS